MLRSGENIGIMPDNLQMSAWTGVTNCFPLPHQARQDGDPNLVGNQR